MNKEMCDIKTISECLDLSIPYIRKLTRAKMIPHYRFGNRLKFDLKEINEWIELHKEKEREYTLFY